MQVISMAYVLKMLLDVSDESMQQVKWSEHKNHFDWLSIRLDSLLF